MSQSKYNLLFWVLVGCTIVTVIVTLFMMYRMSQKPAVHIQTPPAAAAAAAKAMAGITGVAGVSGVSENFAETTDGAYMVYIYSDGCGWCDRFNPVWRDFTERYTGPLAVKKVESRSADAKDYKVTGYPTVLIVEGGVQKAVFKEDRTVENLVKFAQANS